MLGGSPAAPPFASISGCGPCTSAFVRFCTTSRAIEMTSSREDGACCDGGRPLLLSTEYEEVSSSMSASVRVPISQLQIPRACLRTRDPCGPE